MITRNSNDLQDSFRKTLQDFLLFEPMVFVTKKYRKFVSCKKKVYYNIKKKVKERQKRFPNFYIDSFSRDHSIEEVREDAHKKVFF